MCFLDFHNWSPWKEVGRGELVIYDDGRRAVKGFFIKQERYCYDCQKIELDIQKKLIDD